MYSSTLAYNGAAASQINPQLSGRDGKEHSLGGFGSVRFLSLLSGPSHTESFLHVFVGCVAWSRYYSAIHVSNADADVGETEFAVCYWQAQSTCTVSRSQNCFQNPNVRECCLSATVRPYRRRSLRHHGMRKLLTTMRDADADSLRHRLLLR